MTDTHSGLSKVGPIVVQLVGFFLLRNFGVAISVSPHVCFYLSFNSDFYVSKIMHL